MGSNRGGGGSRWQPYKRYESCSENQSGFHLDLHNDRCIASLPETASRLKGSCQAGMRKAGGAVADQIVMTRYKGRTNAKLFERDFPHHVEMIVPERKLPQRCEDHSSKLDDEDRDGN